jgi:PPOX class probable F420-dependent enzyme
LRLRAGVYHGVAVTDPALTVERVMSEDLRTWMTQILRFPVLAVVNPDGAPTQSVMWFDLDPDDPDTIVMNTKVGRAKDRDLRRDPRVSLCFEDELSWVALQGEVELDDDRDRALRGIQALALRYGDDPSEFEGQQRVTIRLRVRKVIRHE